VECLACRRTGKRNLGISVSMSEKKEGKAVSVGHLGGDRSIGSSGFGGWRSWLGDLGCDRLNSSSACVRVEIFGDGVDRRARKQEMTRNFKGDGLGLSRIV
jgi:hypothetical protein